jgi:uncharacterized protein YjdB
MTIPRSIIKALALCLASMFFSAAASEKCVAILEPEGNAAVTPMNKIVVRGIIKEIIVNTKIYRAIARDDASIDALLKELEFQRSKLSDANKAKELGEILGADIICSVKLFADKDELAIEFDLVDVRSAENLNAGFVYIENYSNAAIKAALEPKIYKMLGISTATPPTAQQALGADRQLRNATQATSSPAQPMADRIGVSGIRLNKTRLHIFLRGNEQLIGTIMPSNASNKGIRWSTDNPSVALVSQSGTVMAIAPGTATITAKTSNGGYSAICIVTVTSSSEGQARTGEHYEKGMAFYDRRNWNAAIREFNEAIGLLPKAEYFYARGSAYFRKRGCNKAIRDFGNAVSRSPRDSRYTQTLA